MKQKKSTVSRAATRPPRPKRPSAPMAHEVRIIGGLWKRTKLPVADKPGLRPTPDRVRETVFNWLGQDLSGWHCVDAFAGTGALGFEAASRGAAEVRMVEHDAALVAQLKTIQTKLSATALTILRGDGVSVLKQVSPATMDVVFLDPPFDAGLCEAALGAAARAIRPGGYVYLETPTAWTDEALAPFGLKTSRHLKAGAVHAHLLTPAGSHAA